LRFSKPIYVGDEITTKVTVTEKKDRNKVVLECVCTNQRNEIVTSGVAEIIAPTQSVSLEAVQLEFEQIN
ncbi:MAG: phosphate acetyltransferase, partial [Pseudomonadota bacterium]|nr:phosphate acetyltransferase [Pseudomonadota bacterium]